MIKKKIDAVQQIHYDKATKEFIVDTSESIEQSLLKIKKFIWES